MNKTAEDTVATQLTANNPILGEIVDEGDGRHSYRVAYFPVSELHYWEKNPRKITPKKLKELYNSLKRQGEGSIITIDEDKKVIGGNHRVRALKEYEPNAIVLCKQIYGRTYAEKVELNITLNEHKSEWEFDMLASITKDLAGIEDLTQKFVDHDAAAKQKLLEPVPFERYDFFVIACKTEGEIAELESKLGLKDTFTKLHPTNGRKAKTRAIWYSEREFDIVPRGGK